MQFKKRLFPRFTIFYILLCSIVITADYFNLEWTYYLTKPLVVISLMILFKTESGPDMNPGFRNFILAGLLFSVVGDVLMMFTDFNSGYFLGGLIFFLFAHLYYTGGFLYQVLKSRPWNQHWSQLALATLIVVYGAEFFILNRESFGELKIPVLVYCIAITTMGVAAVMRDRYKTGNGYTKVIVGAVFFIISDSLIAADKFISSFENSGPIILLTYFIAQYLIATGCLERPAGVIMQTK